MKYTCLQCGEVFQRSPAKLVSERVYCGKICFGLASRKPPLVAATFNDYMANFDALMQYAVTAGNGYLIIRARIAGKRYRIYQHRLVLQKKLGRELRSDEVAHHIDGCRSNNDPVNLAVMVGREHAREHLLERVAANGPMVNPYRAPTVTVECANCGIVFTKPKHLHLKGVRKGQRPCCSRSCAAKFSRIEA